jgi:1,2-diacylglycerol 3-alpha-glucosyltransferase
MAVKSRPEQVVVIWIDWYAYHIARFQALAEHKHLRGRMTGIELVGGAGVHQGFVFREKASETLPVITLAPEASWNDAGQRKLAVAVWRKLQELKPSAVLVPGYYTAPALAAALWCKLHGKRSVLMTESTQADHQRSGWKEKLKSLLLRSLFDWAVAGGKAHIRYLQALDFPMERVGRNYDVVDNSFFAGRTDMLRRTSSRKESDLPEHYFLYVGRLAAEKNVDGLLQEFATYRNNGGTWHLVLAGDGPQRQQLMSLTEKLKLSADIHFAGHKDSAGLIPYYAFAGCFVLPSSREPWGLVVNEAMAAGLPVIVSDRCGCVEDLVHHERNGYTFQPNVTGDLQSCLTRFSSLDESQRSMMGKVSREIVQNYSPQTWADEVARIVAA